MGKLVGKVMVNAQVDTTGNPFRPSSKRMVGGASVSSSNPEGGMVLEPVKNSIMSSSDGRPLSPWSETNNKRHSKRAWHPSNC